MPHSLIRGTEYSCAHQLTKVKSSFNGNRQIFSEKLKPPYSGRLSLALERMAAVCLIIAGQQDSDDSNNAVHHMPESPSHGIAQHDFSVS